MDYATARWDNPAALSVRPALRGNAAHAGRAAQYVRMSTDMQQYSTANQEEAIARYAAAHGLEVVRTYSDQGKSGLSVQGRDGLCDLLADVVGQRADFATVLVYDVSRWGRFQDCDESAFYEYLCRRSGIRIEYCMEPFTNDGSPMASIIKSLKRVMAGEFSRELSVKVFTGKCRLARMGFRQGGTAGFGLRRMAVDPSGRRRMVLEYGEHKCVHTDRVVQVPGPASELEVVRWMYEEVASRGGTPIPMARELNRRGVLCPDGRPWSAHKVKGVVTNEKYLGHMVFNRGSAKLKTSLVRNPPAQWLRVDGAFPAVVEPQLYDKAARAMAAWSRRITDKAALAALAALLRRRGRLSSNIIDAARGMPCSDVFRQRFGGLTKAYALIGFSPRRDCGYVDGYALRRRRLTVFRGQVARELGERGVTVRRESKVVMWLNERLRLGIMLARCDFVTGRPRWLVQVAVRPHPDWLLIARLNTDGSEIVEYQLFRGGRCHVLLKTSRRSSRAHLTANEPRPLLDWLTAASTVASDGSGSPQARFVS